MDGEDKSFALDYTHGNHLNYESPNLSELNHFLELNYKRAKVAARWSLDKLSSYDLFVIGNPASNSVFNNNEVTVISQYVKQGGGLLLVGKSNVDYDKAPNLNDVARVFGFVFNKVNLESDLINLEHHYVTKSVDRAALSSSTSLSVSDDVSVIASINGKPVAVAVEYGSGRVIGLGSSSLFSSTMIKGSYNINSFNNKLFVSHVFDWLVSTGELNLESIILSLPYELTGWANNLVKDGFYSSVNSVFADALDRFKNGGFDELMTERQAELKAQEEAKRQAAELARKQEEEKKAAAALKRRIEFKQSIKAEAKESAVLNQKDSNGRTFNERTLLNDISRQLAEAQKKKKS